MLYLPPRAIEINSHGVLTRYIGKQDHVLIPMGVTLIESIAFCGCESLTIIIIPNSLESIGECAFFGCTSLTSIVIPEGVKGIGARAFEGCASPRSIFISTRRMDTTSARGDARANGRHDPSLRHLQP